MICKHMTYLSEYFPEILPLLLVAVNLYERFFDLLEESFDFQHFLNLVQVFRLALLSCLNFLVSSFPQENAQIITGKSISRLLL
jgi:hypothetical protein